MIVRLLTLCLVASSLEAAVPLIPRSRIISGPVLPPLIPPFPGVLVPGDYATLEAAVIANETNILIVGVQDENPTSTITIDTDDTLIVVDPSVRHPGARTGSPNHYRITPATNGNHVFTISADNVTLVGLDIEQSSTGGSDECIRVQSGGSATWNITVTDCLLKASGAADQDILHIFNETWGSVDFENCILWGSARASLIVQWTDNGTYTGTFNINSCTFYDQTDDSETLFGGHLAVWTASNNQTATVNIFNSIFAEADGVGSLVHYNPGPMFGVADFNVSFCIDDDASITTVLDTGGNNLVSHTWADTDQGVGNFVIFDDIQAEGGLHDCRLTDLGNSNNKAQDSHTDSAEHGLTMPAADIAGTTRPQNTNFDRGAFEVP